MRARTQLRAKFNNTLRNNWNPLFEVSFSKNSIKTIRLFALDFYEVSRAHNLIVKEYLRFPYLKLAGVAYAYICLSPLITLLS